MRTLGATLAAGAGLPPPGAQAQSAAPLRVVLPIGPGADGITGTQALVKAAPDGNTIAFISNNHAVNPSVFPKLPYDSLNDITPISIVGGSPFVLVVNPAKVPARTAKELQAFLKAKPDALNYASSGNGTITHLAGEMFVDAAGVKIHHIPYKGMGPMITDIIAGQVELGVGALGALRRQRSASLPDMPTLAEQGFPEVKAGFARRDDLLMLTSPEAAAQFLRTEQERYGRLVRKAAITPD